MTDEDLRAAVFALQVERFAKLSAYEVEPAPWRAPALREPSPQLRRATPARTPAPLVVRVTAEDLAGPPGPSLLCPCDDCARQRKIKAVVMRPAAMPLPQRDRRRRDRRLLRAARRRRTRPIGTAPLVVAICIAWVVMIMVVTLTTMIA